MPRWGLHKKAEVKFPGWRPEKTRQTQYKYGSLYLNETSSNIVIYLAISQRGIKWKDFLFSDNPLSPGKYRDKF